MSSANFWGKCQPACSLSPERKSAAYRYVADVLNETSRPRFSTQPIGKMKPAFWAVSKITLKMQRVKVTHNFQNKKEVPALHESCVQNVKKQPTIALQIFWVKCFSLNYSAQSAQKCMAVNAFGYNERWR